MNLAENPSTGYIAILLFLIGLFLFISGLNIIKIEKITVSSGFKTWIIGLLLMLAGSFVGFVNIEPSVLHAISNEDQTNEMKTQVAIWHFPSRKEDASKLKEALEKNNYLVITGTVNEEILKSAMGNSNYIAYHQENLRFIAEIKNISKGTLKEDFTLQTLKNEKGKRLQIILTANDKKSELETYNGEKNYSCSELSNKNLKKRNASFSNWMVFSDYKIELEKIIKEGKRYPIYIEHADGKKRRWILANRGKGVDFSIVTERNLKDFNIKNKSINDRGRTLITTFCSKTNGTTYYSGVWIENTFYNGEVVKLESYGISKVDN